jgi:hypothetical protein
VLERDLNRACESRWCLRAVAIMRSDSLTGYTDDGGYENRNSYVVIILK